MLPYRAIQQNSTASSQPNGQDTNHRPIRNHLGEFTSEKFWCVIELEKILSAELTLEDSKQHFKGLGTGKRNILRISCEAPTKCDTRVRITIKPIDSMQAITHIPIASANVARKVPTEIVILDFASNGELVRIDHI